MKASTVKPSIVAPPSNDTAKQVTHAAETNDSATSTTERCSKRTKPDSLTSSGLPIVKKRKRQRQRNVKHDSTHGLEAVKILKKSVSVATSKAIFDTMQQHLLELDQI